MKRFFVTVAACCFAVSAQAQEKPKVDPAKVDAEIATAFSAAPADWKPRLDQDETMKQCSLYRNAPPKNVAEDIQKRAWEIVPYIPTAQFIIPTAYRTTLSGIIRSPVTFLWNVEKK